MRQDPLEYQNLFFQAMWAEDDSKSTSGQKRILNFIATQTATKQRLTQTKVRKDKQGNEFERVETNLCSIASTPIVPLATVKIINSAGAETGMKYLVLVGDREMYLPFGVTNKTIRDLQEILEKAGVPCDEYETQRLAKALAAVCNQDAVRRGQAYRDEFEAINPGLSFKDALTGTGKTKITPIPPKLSSDGAVFIDEGGASTMYGAPSVTYAYSESGWNHKMVQNPQTCKWEQEGWVHVLEGDPLFAGAALYRSGGGGVVHKHTTATRAGWLAAFRSFASRSPVIGALTAQAIGSLGRGFLETAVDVSGLIYLHGKTGLGKSTATKVVASVIGFPRLQDTAHPSPLVGANQTGVAFDRIAQSIRHGFMGIDEIQQNQGAVADFLMRLANGLGRGRSQQAGSINQDLTGWDLTFIINGNDEMETLLMRANTRELSMDKFHEAIRARLLDIDINENPLFPETIKGNESRDQTKIQNDAAMVGLEKHHGAFYSDIVAWLSSNRDRATEIFNAGEHAYLKQYTHSDYEDHLQRGSKNAGYEAVGFVIMKEVLALTDKEIGEFSKAWDKILADNANTMRKEEVATETSGDVHDLVAELDRKGLLTVRGFYAEADSDTFTKQQTNANVRSLDSERSKAGWLAHLDQPHQMAGSGAYSGTLYLVPTGSAAWTDTSLRELKTTTDALIKKCAIKGIIEKPSSGRGDAISKTIGGKKHRVVAIKLTYTPPVVDPPAPLTPAQIQAGAELEAIWEGSK